MLNHKTLRPSSPLSYLHGLALKTWTSYCKREGSAGMDTWNAPTVQSRQPDIQVNGKRGPGRPKMTWKQLTERDHREWKLSAIDPHDRDTWRSGVRSAMRAASQLPGRGPTVTRCGYGLCTCTLIKNPMMMSQYLEFLHV